MTSNPTSMDVFYVRLTFARNRMPRTYSTTVRYFLGLDVTAKHCHIGRCAGKRVAGNAEHGWHAKRKVNFRHNRVRDVIYFHLRALFSSNQSPYDVEPECFMSELGVDHKPDAPDRRDARGDIILTHAVSKHMFVTDVMVKSANIRDPAYASEPLRAAQEGVATKFARYVDNYQIDKADVKPLVFETYGGYAKETFDFFREITQVIAGNDQRVANLLMRSLRERIAVELQTQHAYLIHWIKARDRQWSRQHGPDTTATDSLDQDDLSEELGPSGGEEDDDDDVEM